MAEYKLPYTAKQIEDRLEYIGNMMDSGGNVDYVGIEPAYDDIPKIFFGGALQQTKTEAVVPFRYISKTDDFSGYAEIKAQGNSSMSYPKKNQTVKMFKDEACASKMKVDFKGWGKQNKHVYKANWIDLTQARNVVSARLWADVVKSRANYADLPELLRTSPNQGAVDGFPVKVYAAGVYQGRYTLNIPKDKWTFNMDDELDEHCVLCGENYISGCFRAAANINGSDWSDEIHDVVPASIKTRWNQVISFVMNSTDEEFRANLSQYFYVDSLIDYYLFGLASCGLDAFGKNQIYATYDGQRWIASMYDMDSTWGLYWNGSRFVATDYARTSFEDMVNGRQGNLLYMRLEQLFWSELQTRWEELKNGALSIENIINRFERFTNIAPAELVKEDYASTTGGGKFTGIPSKDTNNIQQIRAFALARLAWTDTYVASLTPEISVPCEGIALDKSTLTFDGEGTQTVTATVIPDGCTDTVVWVSSNPSIAAISVDGTVCTVTAVANGDATITVYCGEYSASCSVSVSGFVSVPDDSIYSLPKAMRFDGTNYIDTGVQLFAEDKPFTLALDWMHTGESQFVSNTHVIAHCMQEKSPWPGLVFQYSMNQMHIEINQTQSAKLSPGSSTIGETGSVRVVFVKNSDGVITVSARYNNAGNIAKVTKQGTFVALTENLLLGCYQDSSGNKGRYAKGILNDCKVYNRALSDEEINAYLLDDSIGEPDEPDIPDGSDIDYTLDALSGVTWLEGYAVDSETGEVGAKTKHYVTEPITLQDCMYQFDNGSGNTYSGISIYDADDNYVGHIETVEDTNFGKFYGNSIYKYRVQVYSTTASHKNAKIIPVNNSTGAKYTALDLSTASWRLAKDAAVTTLTTEQKNCVVGSDQCSVFILANTANQNVVNVKNVLAPDVFYMSSFGDSYYLHAPYFKTVDDATEYFANYTIEFNKRYQVEPDEPVPCEGITLDKTSLTFSDEGTQTLVATITPADTTDKIVWSSDNTAVATVENGVVTAVGNGSATITATCGNHSANCSVAVSGIVEPEMPTDGLLYSVSNQALNGTEAIDTGVKLLESTSEFTIMLEVKPDVQSINNATLLHCMEETSPYLGFSIRMLPTNTCYDIAVNHVGTKFTELSKDTTDRFRIVMIYKSGLMDVHVKNSAGLYSHIVNALVGDFAKVSKTLVIGGYQDSQGTKGRFWTGTIDSCKVYNQIIDSEYIASFIGAESIAPSVNWSNAANGGYDISGNKTTGSNYYTEEPIAVPPNVLVTLENADGASYTYLRVFEYDANGVFVAASAEEGSTNRRRIITNENTAFVNLTAYPAGASTNNDPANQLKLWWLT